MRLRKNDSSSWYLLWWKWSKCLSAFTWEWHSLIIFKEFCSVAWLEYGNGVQTLRNSGEKLKAEAKQAQRSIITQD